MEKARSYQTPETNSSDDIDLSLLGMRIINALQRSFKIFVISIIMGGIFGTLYYYLTPPVYSTSLIASSKVLTNTRVGNLIQVLNELAKENNASQLAKNLHLSNQVAGSIKSIEARDIYDPKADNSVNQMSKLDSNTFEITLVTYDYRLMDSLQAGVLYYLQHNDFVQKRVAIRKQNLEAMLEKVREEQKKLDTLRFSVNKVLSKGIGGNSTMLMLDPGSVNKDIMALYEKELEIKSDLLLIDDIQVIQDFTRFSKPASPKLLQSVATSTGSAVILALIIIAILEARRGIRKLRVASKENLEQKEIG